MNTANLGNALSGSHHELRAAILADVPWHTLPRFMEKRHQFGWRVYENGDDGVCRWTYTGTFWRWITAARVAQALTLAFNAGYHSDGECWQRNLDVLDQRR